MINGLKATVSGKDLKALLINRSDFHDKKAIEFGDQIRKKTSQGGLSAIIDELGLQELNRHKKHHESEADLLSFVSSFVVEHESYLLSCEELVRLGVSESITR
jgi:hypothetical protein